MNSFHIFEYYSTIKKSILLKDYYCRHLGGFGSLKQYNNGWKYVLNFLINHPC
jgi:hypothetical protein